MGEMFTLLAYVVENYNEGEWIEDIVLLYSHLHEGSVIIMVGAKKGFCLVYVSSP